MRTEHNAEEAGRKAIEYAEFYGGKIDLAQGANVETSRSFVCELGIPKFKGKTPLVILSRWPWGQLLVRLESGRRAGRR